MAALQVTMTSDAESMDKITELLWQDALRHLESTNNEVLLPTNVIDQIGQSNVDKIKSRLCALVGAPVVAFVDESIKALRIMRTPTFSGTAVSVASPEVVSKDHKDDASVCSRPSGKPVVPAKALKIPRPPNAFILYRQHHHPKIRVAYPHLHNNDISIILGKQWKSEPDEVRAHYKCLADESKRKHFEEHPDYQYSPRKPSEKKRRTSSRQYHKHRLSSTFLDSPSPPTAPSAASTPDVRSSIDAPNVAMNDLSQSNFATSGMLTSPDLVLDDNFTLADEAFDMLVQQIQDNQSKNLLYQPLNVVNVNINQHIPDTFDLTEFI